MTVPNKRAIIEERKKKWMSDREVTVMREEIAAEVAHKMSSASMSHGSSSSSHASLVRRSSSNIREGSGADVTDQFLSKLSDRLSVHIRNEAKKEMQDSIHSADVRETVAEKMEAYLQAELGTHVCKICFELMTSPVHTPMLLFPCGHTFCKACVESHLDTKLNRNNNKGCPYCRLPIQSKAVNQSLKDLIDQFAKQKELVEKGEIRFVDELFAANSHTHQSKSGSGGGSGDHFSANRRHVNRQGRRQRQKQRGEGGGNDESEEDQNDYDSDYNEEDQEEAEGEEEEDMRAGYAGARGSSDRRSERTAHGSGRNSRSSRHRNSGTMNSNRGIMFVDSKARRAALAMQSQLKSCEVRRVILQNELDDVLAEEKTIEARREKIKDASAHLLSERDKLDAKIALLNEERELIDRHLSNQESKQHELQQLELSLGERATLVQDTLQKMQAEMDKLRLLIQGVHES